MDLMRILIFILLILFLSFSGSSQDNGVYDDHKNKEVPQSVVLVAGGGIFIAVGFSTPVNREWFNTRPNKGKWKRNKWYEQPRTYPISVGIGLTVTGAITTIVK